jgi:hypothetical protein
MLTAEPTLVVDEASVATLAPWSTELEGPTASPLGRAPRPNRYGRIQSKETIRARVVEAQYAQFRSECLNGLPLPPRFEMEEVFRYLRERDSLPPFRVLKDRIDDETLRIMDAQRGGADSSRRSSVVGGVAAARAETNAIRRRGRLLAQQRNAQFLWAMNCSLRGDLPATTAGELGRSYFWEILQLYAVEALLIPAAMDAVEHASSRHRLDGCMRSTRLKLQTLAHLGDRVRAPRERLLLLLDTWNSIDVSAIYAQKAWRATLVPSATLRDGLIALANSVNALEAGLQSEFGTTQLAPLATPEGSDLPIARAMFGAMMEEAVA